MLFASQEVPDSVEVTTHSVASLPVLLVERRRKKMAAGIPIGRE
jgi:hypothetical protein